MHQIYYAKIKPLLKEERYNFYFQRIPKSRQERASNHLHKIDKIRSVAAFSLLMKLLDDNHIPYQNNSFKIDKNGKLYLASSDIYLNIAHGGNYVIAGISDSPIGVDVENINREKKYKEIVNLVFNQNEREKFRHLVRKKIFFYQVWTTKESYVKCIGKGLQVGMTTIDIPSLKEKGYHFKLFFLKKHQFAICNEGKPVENIKEVVL
ncbi:MAG: 4'-phosphopantetheinyl transferase superfamily protein [Bacilli bacterium]|nr:4'-phosphopantetheinyl transferase superfamily protein [Bacilli bacterium]